MSIDISKLKTGDVVWASFGLDAADAGQFTVRRTNTLIVLERPGWPPVRFNAVTGDECRNTGSGYICLHNLQKVLLPFVVVQEARDRRTVLADLAVAKSRLDSIDLGTLEISALQELIRGLNELLEAYQR